MQKAPNQIWSATALHQPHCHIYYTSVKQVDPSGSWTWARVTFKWAKLRSLVLKRGEELGKFHFSLNCMVILWQPGAQEKSLTPTQALESVQLQYLGKLRKAQLYGDILWRCASYSYSEKQSGASWFQVKLKQRSRKSFTFNENRRNTDRSFSCVFQLCLTHLIELCQSIYVSTWPTFLLVCQHTFTYHTLFSWAYT